MNNLILATVITASLGGLLLAENAFYRAGERENRRLVSSAREAERGLANGRDTVTSAQAQLRQRRDSPTLMADLHADAVEPVPPMNPEGEGLWPVDKPYYYLPKNLLPLAFFQQFKGSERGLRLTPTTVTMLGMSSEEASAVDDGFENLVVQFKQLEVDNLAPSDVHASTNFQNGTKTSYRLPPLRTEMEPAIAEYFASTRALLGNARADIFQKWAERCILESLGNFAPKARILTFTEVKERKNPRLFRFEVVEEGGKFLSYAELWDPPRDEFLPPGFPEDTRPRFAYRHLFGERGEKRP